MTSINVINELFGGALIGLSAALLLLFNGKIAGISGIFFRGVVSFHQPWQEKTWRLIFVIAMIITGAWLMFSEPQLSSPALDYLNSQPMWLWAVAGLLVGIGTKLANGCTSGHAICGVGRFSRRSLVATAVFMATAMLTVWIKSQIGL